MKKATKAKKPVKKDKYDEVFEFPELEGKSYREVVNTVLKVERPVKKKKSTKSPDKKD